MDEKKARKWLNLTQQQYDIVKVIYRIRNRGIKPTPKEIQREYKREHGRVIIKPNLFNLLRTLQQKKVVDRVAQAEYVVNQDGIRQLMDEALTQLDKEKEDLQLTQQQVDEFFKEITYKKEMPDIHYLEGEELYRAMAETLENSAIFYIVADFPVIAYTREMTHTLQREAFAEMLWHKCLKEKRTKIRYLTDLNIDVLFNHAFRTYGDPKTAYRESQATMDRLQTQIETHKNLEVRYTDTPHGLDVAITQQNEPTEFIIFTRDEHNDIRGGILIKSRKTATNALRTYLRTYEYSTPLNTPQGKTIIEKTKQNIKQKYGILGE